MTKLVSRTFMKLKKHILLKSIKWDITYIHKTDEYNTVGCFTGRTYKWNDNEININLISENLDHVHMHVG